MKKKVFAIVRSMTMIYQNSELLLLLQLLWFQWCLLPTRQCVFCALVFLFSFAEKCMHLIIRDSCIRERRQSTQQTRCYVRLNPKMRVHVRQWS